MRKGNPPATVSPTQMLTSRIPEASQKLPRLALDAFEMLEKVGYMIEEAVEPIHKKLPKINDKILALEGAIQKTNEKVSTFKSEMEKLEENATLIRQLEKACKHLDSRCQHERQAADDKFKKLNEDLGGLDRRIDKFHDVIDLVQSNVNRKNDQVRDQYKVICNEQTQFGNKIKEMTDNFKAKQHEYEG